MHVHTLAAGIILGPIASTCEGPKVETSQDVLQAIFNNLESQQ